jgi:hypothetical protein
LAEAPPPPVTIPMLMSPAIRQPMGPHGLPAIPQAPPGAGGIRDRDIRAAAAEARQTVAAAERVRAERHRGASPAGPSAPKWTAAEKKADLGGSSSSSGPAAATATPSVPAGTIAPAASTAVPANKVAEDDSSEDESYSSDSSTAE